MPESLQAIANASSGPKAKKPAVETPTLHAPFERRSSWAVSTHGRHLESRLYLDCDGWPGISCCELPTKTLFFVGSLPFRGQATELVSDSSEFGPRETEATLIYGVLLMQRIFCDMPVGDFII